MLIFQATGTALAETQTMDSFIFLSYDLLKFCFWPQEMNMPSLVQIVFSILEL
jgi:hypothetical protein